MSAIDVMYTRTSDGDYMADFDCSDSDLPKSNVFFFCAITDEELAQLRATVARHGLDLATIAAVLFGDDNTAGNGVREICAEIREQKQRIAELESALAYDDKHCPLCTWRGQVELVDGICPQCDVNWDALYKAGSDERQEAKRRIAALEAKDKARIYTIDYLKRTYDYDERVLVGDMIRMLSAHPAAQHVR